MSTVQQLLNVLKKTFYDLTPASNKQMSLMSMANGGIKITQFCTAGINNGGPKQNCCDVTNFHQVATVASASFQSSLFYYPWFKFRQCEDYSEQSKPYFEPLTFPWQRCLLQREYFDFVCLHFH